LPSAFRSAGVSRFVGFDLTVATARSCLRHIGVARPAASPRPPRAARHPQEAGRRSCGNPGAAPAKREPRRGWGATPSRHHRQQAVARRA